MVPTIQQYTELVYKIYNDIIKLCGCSMENKHILYIAVENVIPNNSFYVCI